MDVELVSAMVAEATAESDDVGLVSDSRGAGASAAMPRQALPDGLQQLRVSVCMATFSLGIQIDLTDLVKAIPNSMFIGANATIRTMREPRYAVSISKSGAAKIFTTYDGETARLAAKRAARLVKRLYSASASFRRYKVRNLIAIAKLRCGIDIEGFGSGLRSAPGLKPPQVHPFHVREFSSKRALVDVEVERNESRPDEQRHAHVRVLASGQIALFGCRSLGEAASVLKVLAPTVRSHPKWW